MPPHTTNITIFIINVLYSSLDVFPLCFRRQNINMTYYCEGKITLYFIYPFILHYYRMFLLICIIHYAQLYKSSRALFYDLVMTIVTIVHAQ